MAMGIEPRKVLEKQISKPSANQVQMFGITLR